MSNFEIRNLFGFKLWISFGIDSPSVHHFVRALTFGIFSLGAFDGLSLFSRVYPEYQGEEF